MHSFLSKEIEKNYDKKTIFENYKKIIIILNPILPHFSNECLSMLGVKKDLLWPVIDENLIKEEKINYVIQINGKKRAIINTDVGITEKVLTNLVQDDNNLKKYLEGKKIKKIIFVKNRLMNIIL